MGKLMVSPTKTEFINHSVAFHMGVLAWEFQSGALDKNLMENIDKTHFVINMDNGRTLGFRGDKVVEYADMVAGGLGITMVVKVTEGVFGKIGVMFLIFQNVTCSYPICEVPDNVLGVCYQSAKKGFMTGEILIKYYKEASVPYADPSGCMKVQWLDNAPDHKILPECTTRLDRIRTILKHFPQNITHLT